MNIWEYDGESLSYTRPKPSEKSMVLRSVLLPVLMEEPLRKLASELKVSKGELIRQLIEIGFKHKDELNGKSSSL